MTRRAGVKKPTKTANILATLYEGGFQISFDCVGVEACWFALCPMMPPDGSEDCTYSEHGSCLCPGAKAAGLESLRNRLTKELKQLTEDSEG
jgi:hypothetical protein